MCSLRECLWSGTQHEIICQAVERVCTCILFLFYLLSFPFGSSQTNMTLQKVCRMKLLELDDSISRFRLAQSCLGLAGCFCVSYSVWTPFWLNNRGLWSEWNRSRTDQESYEEVSSFDALEAGQVFGILSFLMALSTSALCLVFAFCWTSKTVRSYSNTRSLLMAGQALYPTTLLLLTMASTGFFFLLCWSFFTYQHQEEIRQDFTGLGASYWLGALGYVLLIVVELIVFVAEQILVPDILPDLEKAVETWRAASQFKAAKRSFSDSYFNAARRSDAALSRLMSAS